MRIRSRDNKYRPISTTTLKGFGWFDSIPVFAIINGIRIQLSIQKLSTPKSSQSSGFLKFSSGNAIYHSIATGWNLFQWQFRWILCSKVVQAIFWMEFGSITARWLKICCSNRINRSLKSSTFHSLWTSVFRLGILAHILQRLKLEWKYFWCRQSIFPTSKRDKTLELQWYGRTSLSHIPATRKKHEEQTPTYLR